VDLTVPAAARAELASVFLQTAITLGLAVLCGLLYRRYRKPYFAWWALAWVIYALRLGAIISFVLSGQRYWLYWHQVTTGWTALALLWAALVFSQQLRWRNGYFAAVMFPPLWSFVAIYRLENFLLAAGPAVLFLSGATLWTGWVFYRHWRTGRATAALGLSVAMFLWAIHHLDYPLLRARGVWNPWGYYLDVAFELAVGAGILLLVLEDLHHGVAALSALSSELQSAGRKEDLVEALLGRLLTLPAVSGSAIYLVDGWRQQLLGAAGSCRDWAVGEPSGAARLALEGVRTAGAPEVIRGAGGSTGPGPTRHAYTAALPVLRGSRVIGGIIIVGDTRDPFAALDDAFLQALGRQVGAALENADLHRGLASRTADLERLAQRMVQQHEEERRRLSRELHDETAQLLSAVKLELGVTRERVPPDLSGSLDKALGLLDEGIRSVRNVTNDLRPALLEDLGLLPALRALVRAFGERSGIEASFVADDALPALAQEAELAVFRAVQEGLSNVARHAGAEAVTVTLRSDGPDVALTVRDDGRGFAGSAAPGGGPGNYRMGLTGMRERLAGVGGTLDVANARDGGAELKIRVPAAASGVA
jgi:signal transduction histidine kinase